MSKGLKIFGKKLAAMREAKLLSQEELAAKGGLSKGGVARIEGLEVATVQKRTLRGFAEALGVSPDQLVISDDALETVTLELPRDAYDRIVAIAKQKGRTVEDHIVRSAGGAFGLLIESTQPHEGEEAPGQPEPSASGAPSKKGNRRRSRSARDRDG